MGENGIKNDNGWIEEELRKIEIEKPPKYKWNKSAIFVRGMLGYSMDFYEKQFYNSYITIKPPCIFLTFIKPLTPNYDEIFNELKKHKDYFGVDDYEKYVVYKFNISTEHIDNFNKFLRGNYRGLSEEYKRLLFVLHPYSDLMKNLQIILFPTEEDIRNWEIFWDMNLPKNIELTDIPNMIAEIYDVNKLKN